MSSIEDHIKLLESLISDIEIKQSISYNPKLNNVLLLMKDELSGIINFINNEDNDWVFKDVDDQI